MKEVEQFYNRLLKINYGWHDKSGNLHTKIDTKIFANEFKMQQYNKVEESGHAICWEMCELERHFFDEHRIENHTIMAVIKKENGGCPCHTFITIILDGQLYWFEASWIGQKGIRKFKDINELKNFIRYNFQDFAKKSYDPDAIEFIEYGNPTDCTDFYSFFENALKGTKI